MATVELSVLSVLTEQNGVRDAPLAVTPRVVRCYDKYPCQKTRNTARRPNWLNNQHLVT